MRIIFFLSLLVSSSIAFGQTQTPEEEMLEKILPLSFDEYKRDGVPMTVTSRSDDRAYIMSSQNYKKRNMTVSIVIFDYKESPMLLKKYTSSWEAQNVDDGKMKISQTKVGEFVAWQSFDKVAKGAQLYVNINDRYLLFLSGNNQSIEYLKSVAELLKLRQLPK